MLSSSTRCYKGNTFPSLSTLYLVGAAFLHVYSQHHQLGGDHMTIIDEKQQMSMIPIYR